MSNRRKATTTTPAETPAEPRYLTDERVEIEGRTFRFHGEDATVEIPLRMKLGLLRSLAGRDLDAETMFEILAKIAPAQEAALDDLDVLEFQALFSLWQEAYNAGAGATLGEASGSSI